MTHDPGGQLPLAELARLYIETLAEDARAAEGLWNHASTPVPAARVGDLWVTVGEAGDAPLIVALTWVGIDGCRGVITLDDPLLAASDDVLVSREHSPTGASMALCAWREVPIALSSLHTLLGALPDSIVEPLVMALQDHVSGGFVRVPLGAGRQSSGEPFARWSIAPAVNTAHAREYGSGAPIISAADPRVDVRAALVSGSAYLERLALVEPASIVPFKSPREVPASPSAVKHVTVVAWAAAGNKPLDPGRRFLNRGREEIKLDNRTTVEVQERDGGELWIRWMNGPNVRIIGDEVPLDNRSRQLHVVGRMGVMDVLRAQLEWVD